MDQKSLEMKQRTGLWRLLLLLALSKEGQELYSRALTQGSPRTDVHTKWPARFDTPAAKISLLRKSSRGCAFTARHHQQLARSWRGICAEDLDVAAPHGRC